MKILDAKIDNAPNETDIKELAELRIRNLLCFSELKNLNDTGRLLNKHPILKHDIEYEQLLTLWINNKDGFIQQYENCRNNIRRYSARLKKADISADDATDALQSLERHQERAIIFKKILSNEPNN